MTTQPSPLPTLSILASALKLVNPTDGAIARAADKTLEYLTTDPAYEFDGVELRIVSQSEREAGTWYVADAVGCTCKGGKHPMCKHRALFRILMALEALRDPQYLKIQMLEQTAPAGFDTPPMEAPYEPALTEQDWYAV